MALSRGKFILDKLALHSVMFKPVNLINMTLINVSFKRVIVSINVLITKVLIEIRRNIIDFIFQF